MYALPLPEETKFASTGAATSRRNNYFRTTRCPTEANGARAKVLPMQTAQSCSPGDARDCTGSRCSAEAEGRPMHGEAVRIRIEE